MEPKAEQQRNWMVFKSSLFSLLFVYAFILFSVLLNCLQFLLECINDCEPELIQLVICNIQAHSTWFPKLAVQSATIRTLGCGS